MDSVISWAILTAAAVILGLRFLIRRTSYLGKAHSGFNPCPDANSIYSNSWQKFATGE